MPWANGYFKPHLDPCCDSQYNEMIKDLDNFGIEELKHLDVAFKMQVLPEYSKCVQLELIAPDLYQRKTWEAIVKSERKIMYHNFTVAYKEPLTDCHALKGPSPRQVQLLTEHRQYWHDQVKSVWAKVIRIQALKFGLDIL